MAQDTSLIDASLKLLDTSTIAQQLLSSIFYHPRRIKQLVRYWSSRPIYEHHSPWSAAFWKELTVDLYRPLQLTVTRDSLSIFAGDSSKYFPIPLGILTVRESRQLAALCQRRAFGARGVIATENRVQVSAFQHDAAIQNVISRTAILEQFVRLAVETCSNAALWEPLQRIFQNLSLSYGAAACMSLRFTSTIDLYNRFHSLWDVMGSPGVLRCLTDSLNAELPSRTQARAMAEIVEGWGVVHLDASKHEVFHRHLADALRIASRHGHGSRSADYVSLIVREAKSDDSTGKLQYTVTRFRRRTFWTAMMHVLFSQWLLECAPSWAAIPPFARQFIATMPRMFGPGLDRLGLLSPSEWLHRLCLPYLDPLLLPPAPSASAAADKKQPVGRDRDSWIGLVFLATRYILSWHPQSEQLCLETWLSNMLRLLHGDMPASLPRSLAVSSKELVNVLADMRAVANALRALFHLGPSACLLPALPILDNVSRRIGPAIFQQSPDLSPLQPRRSKQLPSRPEHPTTGISAQFEWFDAGVLEANLINGMRHHEWRSEWRTSAATHACIRFPKDVSLMDLQYSLDWHYSQRQWLDSDWRCFRLSDGSVAAIVPRQAFLDGCARNYLLQRLSAAATMEALDSHASLKRLPLYPFVVQAFFSSNRDLQATALFAMYSWLTNAPRKGITVQFDQGVILAPDHVDFGFYQRLPAIVQNLCNPAQHDSILDLYRNSFRDDFCVFADDEKKHFHHLARDAPCFVIGLTGMIALGAEHYMRSNVASQIIRELEKIPQFQQALLSRRQSSTAEQRGYAVLQMVKTANEAAAPPTSAGPSMRAMTLLAPNSIMAAQQLVPLRWPKDDPNVASLPHVAVYELLELSYLPVELRRLLLFSISCGLQRETDVHALSGRVDVLQETWHNKQYSLQAQAQPRTSVAAGSEFETESGPWRLMTELTRTLEYGFHCVQTLTSDQLTASHPSRQRMWVLRTDQLAYLVDPRTHHAPSAIYHEQPVWRDRRMIIYHNPMSSRHTRIDEPPPLYSATDTFLEFVLIQSFYHQQQQRHERLEEDGLGSWAPAPLAIGLKHEDLKREQETTFPLNIMSFADWPRETKKTEAAGDSKALVVATTTMTTTTTTTTTTALVVATPTPSVSPSPSPTPTAGGGKRRGKPAKVVRTVWRYPSQSPTPMTQLMNDEGDDSDVEMRS